MMTDLLSWNGRMEYLRTITERYRGIVPRYLSAQQIEKIGGGTAVHVAPKRSAQGLTDANF